MIRFTICFLTEKCKKLAIQQIEKKGSILIFPGLGKHCKIFVVMQYPI